MIFKSVQDLSTSYLPWFHVNNFWDGWDMSVIPSMKVTALLRVCTACYLCTDRQNKVANGDSTLLSSGTFSSCTNYFVSTYCWHHNAKKIIATVVASNFGPFPASLDSEMKHRMLFRVFKLLNSKMKSNPK